MFKGEFWAIPKEIMEQKDISIQAKFLFGVLWTRMNGENIAWPSQQYLAEQLNCGKRSVQRYLEELKRHNLIESKQIGLHCTNRYKLKLNGKIGVSRSDRAVAIQDTPTVATLIVREQKKENIRKSGDSLRFIPPSLKELTDYCNEHRYPINPQQFLDFYESKGWMVGRNKMKNWQAAVRTWVTRNRDKSLYKSIKERKFNMQYE